ncbi:MAG: cysteine-rich CWC family protein [Bacteroidota bacterium]|nr:cysteine-rich CWC family protein [Bacteroidota bacterium]
MAHHENKNCPRCNTSFECKVGNVLECQCSQVKLKYDERVYVESLYTDCLCINCLRILQQQYLMLRKKTFDF